MSVSLDVCFYLVERSLLELRDILVGVVLSEAETNWTVSSVLSYAGNDTGRERTFLDKDVCRPFILGICINDLFVNTVSDSS